MSKKISKVMQRLLAERARKKNNKKHKTIETIEETFDIPKLNQLRQKYKVETDSDGLYLRNDAFMDYNMNIPLNPYEQSYVIEYGALCGSVKTGAPDDLDRNSAGFDIHQLKFFVTNSLMCLTQAGFLIHLWCKPVLDAKGSFLNADEFCDWLGIP